MSRERQPDWRFGVAGHARDHAPWLAHRSDSIWGLPAVWCLCGEPFTSLTGREAEKLADHVAAFKQPVPHKEETPAATGGPKEERHNTLMNATDNDTTLDLLARNHANTFALLDAAISAPAKTPHEVMLEQAEVDRELLGINPAIFPDDSPRARLSDPDTSHEAADSTTNKRAASQAEVIRILTEFHMLADHQIVQAHQAIQERIGEDPKFSPQRLRTARHELVEFGLVKFTGLYTLTPSGRRARVWGLR